MTTCFILFIFDSTIILLIKQCSCTFSSSSVSVRVGRNVTSYWISEGATLFLISSFFSAHFCLILPVLFTLFTENPQHHFLFCITEQHDSGNLLTKCFHELHNTRTPEESVDLRCNLLRLPFLNTSCDVNPHLKRIPLMPLTVVMAPLRPHLK